MRTEPRAQLHKPVKKFFSTHLGGAPAPGAPLPTPLDWPWSTGFLRVRVGIKA